MLSSGCLSESTSYGLRHPSLRIKLPAPPRDYRVGPFLPAASSSSYLSFPLAYIESLNIASPASVAAWAASMQTT